MKETIKKAIVIIKSYEGGNSQVEVEFKGQIWSKQEIIAAHKHMDLEQRKIRSSIRRKDDRKRKQEEAAILATEEKDEKDHFKKMANNLFGGSTEEEVEESEEVVEPLEIELIAEPPADEEIPEIPEVVSQVSEEKVTEVHLGSNTNDKEIGDNG